jgi:hypothetical protein
MKVRILSYLKRKGKESSILFQRQRTTSLLRGELQSLLFDSTIIEILCSKQCWIDSISSKNSASHSLEQEIKKNAKDSKYARIIMSVPGIDYYLASLYVSYIGDPHRFPSFDHVASFLGIIHSGEQGQCKCKKKGKDVQGWSFNCKMDSICHGR